MGQSVRDGMYVYMRAAKRNQCSLELAQLAQRLELNIRGKMSKHKYMLDDAAGTLSQSCRAGALSVLLEAKHHLQQCTLLNGQCLA